MYLLKFLRLALNYKYLTWIAAFMLRNGSDAS